VSRHRSISLAAALALTLIVLSACSSGGSAPCAAGETCLPLDTDGGQDAAHGDVSADGGDGTGDGSGALPEPRCGTADGWTPGAALFREVTDEWGLEGVVGTTISVGDIDADGYPDVFVRDSAARWNDHGPEGNRAVWLLRNTGSGFEDVTASSGVEDRRAFDATRGRPIGVVAFADVDNDGDLDVYTGADTFDLTASANETSELMLNSGEGTFFFTSPDSALRRPGAADSPASASFTDVDRDGVVDLWVPQQEYTDPDAGHTIPQDQLYRGLGDGRFDNATEVLGLTTEAWSDVAVINAGGAHSRAWSATACDLNDDGTPELLAAAYGRSPNHLWESVALEAGGFEWRNRSVASGYAFDDDRSWQDNEFAKCFCEANREADGCADVSAPRVSCPTPANWRHDTDREAYRLGGNSGTTVCADLDNDGDLDLLTTEIKHWWAGDGADESTVLWNTGEAEVRFERRPRAETGLEVPHPSAPSWDEGHISATVLDVDNDGWPDIYIGGSEYAGNEGLLYRQRTPGVFELLGESSGLQHNRSLGVAAADFDRDGDLDLIVGHSRARCDASGPNDCYPTRQVRLFENVFGQDRGWVQLRLEGGEGSNRAAIGARVTVTAGGVTQTQEVGGGYGRSGAQNDLLLHFGLGDACDARVEVRWPDADLSTQTFDVVAGHRFHVVQGQPPLALEAGR
jgi:hypothetical protein